jgi:hypothetical protein
MNRCRADLDTSIRTRSRGGRSVFTVVGLVAAVVVGLVIAIRRVQPEPTFEPGLEFNPDFDLTVDEILADIRGNSPHG